MRYEAVSLTKRLSALSAAVNPAVDVVLDVVPHVVLVLRPVPAELAPYKLLFIVFHSTCIWCTPRTPQEPAPSTPSPEPQSLQHQ